MNYELAKSLKDAGFPQRGDVHPDYKDSSLQWGGNRREGYIYIPTLEELIEACGKTHRNYLAQDCVFFLGFNNEVWTTGYCDPDTQSVPFMSEVGSTPTEVVARLWLALNKK